MGSRKLSKALLFTIVCLGIGVACSSAPQSRPRTIEQPMSMPSSATDKGESSSVRAVDFANFTYPWLSDFGEPSERFTLAQGKYSGTSDLLPMDLFSTVYTDVTGDNREEAIVVLSVLVERAPAAPHASYIYALENDKPKLLWAFATGDRSAGGLRRIYSEKGKLVVELYGKGKILGNDLYANDGSDAEVPYPYYFTRTRYEWNGTHFGQVGPVEILADHEKYGIPIMPLYRP